MDRRHLLASDLAAFMRGDLRTLQTEVNGAIGRTTDEATRLHLDGVARRIEQILDEEE